MDGMPCSFNPDYIADIKRALIELGDKNGLFYLLHDAANQRGLVVRSDKGLMVVTMGMRDSDARPDGFSLEEFKPRRMPRTSR